MPATHNIDLGLEAGEGQEPDALSGGLVLAATEITPEALEVLSTDFRKEQQAPTLKTLSSVHHFMANLFARGCTNKEVIAITGYSDSRVSILKHTPAMQSAIAGLQQLNVKKTELVLEKTALLAMTTVDELQRRIEETPELVDSKTLNDIIRNTLDHTGHSPVQKTAAVIAFGGLDEQELMKRKQALQQSHKGKIIDAEIIPQAEEATRAN